MCKAKLLQDTVLVVEINTAAFHLSGSSPVGFRPRMEGVSVEGMLTGPLALKFNFEAHINIPIQVIWASPMFCA